MDAGRSTKMGTAPMFPLVMAMSFPAMLSMLVQALYNVVDSYFVAKISESALTAVSLAFPLQTLMIAVAIGTAVGLNSLISRRLGEGRQKDADRAATHGLILGVVNWIVFALVGLLGTNAFFNAFTDDPVVHQMGCDYTYVVLIVSFGIFVEANVSRTLQATGNMIIPMVTQLAGAITNIIMDPILIFGLLGFPRLEVMGAAVATVAGQIVAMIIALLALFFKDHDVHISFRGFRPHWRTIRDIYAVGFPSMVMQAIGSVMTAGMNAILISFSQTAVALFGVYFKLQSFVFMPVFGLNTGLMPIIGYNYGAGNRKRLLSALKIGAVIAAVIMAVGMAVFWIFPEWLLGIFEASDEMVEIGVPALRSISLCFVPAAIGIICSTLFQAVGMGTRSLFVSLLRQLILILPVAYLLSKIGLNYVWYAFPIAETFSLLASVLLALSVYKHKIRGLVPIRGEE
ncbi:Staphylococcal virulence regulator protein A [uncultured Ruminococcus sp.]|uniref:Probable multidrug resistance protein NorM n=1 Tax=Massiliimalia timonensis TaxID=1987501 RepID=A0A8J6P3R1_9FIRM|nr:MATE family efflux transporter [Massiliimalia timonensis]MBC8610593.1 MATE family efflux transporter [Massiliimalia timonensis]MBS7174801.1 MATE family efflux transporter [Clostridiales bacterium]SCH90847.1 Staphylococcal virulence regulator protein A [uncultured Clostridium sp.]SCI23752.1 Staphylococcal virulence regulator protein A [uncultured Ruminococcus sp.]